MHCYLNANTSYRFVNQYNEEYDQQKKARRPGRPASAREDLLKATIHELKTEFQKGFCKAIWQHDIGDLPLTAI